MSSIESKIETLATADDLPQVLAEAMRRGHRGAMRRVNISPELSYGRHAGPAPHTARAAAVVLLLFRRDDPAGGARRWHLPLTERPTTLARHAGQISLPGGAVDAGETSMEAALRELNEELGFQAPHLVIGQLADCYVFASDFLVTPWVIANFEPVTKWRPNEREVQSVVELPLEMLLDDGAIGRLTVERGPLVSHSPCIRVGTARVWGATSVILNELADVLRYLVEAPWVTETQLNQNDPILRAVVFDLDGLIANTEDLYEQAGETVLRRRGKTYDADLREKIMGRPVIDAIQMMIDCHSLPDTANDLMCECADVLKDLIATSLAPMPGVMRLLDDLQSAATPIAVATSATREYADHVLTRLNIKQRFRFILTAADIDRGKPDPEIYLLAAARLGLAPPQIMVLEDSANGCRAAVDAGAFTVGVPNRHTRDHNFSGVRFVADTLDDPRIRQTLRLN